MSTETKVKERPILFSGPMVRAILEGRQTQTRRIVKLANAYHDCGRHEIMEWRNQNEVWFGLYEWNTVASLRCPYGSVSERLWVRETFRNTIDDKSFCCIQYKSDESIRSLLCDNNGEGDCVGTKNHKEPLQQIGKPGPPYKPSIHMPRWASRITLEITSVRIERLNNISEADALAEGIERRNISWNHAANEYKYYGWLEKHDQWSLSPLNSYESLWESINGPGSWAINPWVWVIEFKQISNL